MVSDTLVKKPITKQEFLTLSYARLKQETGIDVKNWWKWLNGEASPNLNTLEQIASQLQIPVLELVEAFLERRSRTLETKNRKSSAA